MVMTRPAFIYILPIYILFWILRFIYERKEKKQIIIGFVSCLVCGVILLSYCGFVKQKQGVFGLTTVSNTNSLLSVISSKAYKNASNNEIIKIADENDLWVATIEIQKKYSDTEVNQFIKESKKTSDYYMYLMKRTVKNGFRDIGINYAEKENSGKFYRYIGLVTLPIPFMIVYILMLTTIVFLVINIVKNKKINWIIAFCTSMISANIFTLIIGAPAEEARLFSPSISIVLILFAYILPYFIEKGKKIIQEKKGK